MAKTIYTQIKQLFGMSRGFGKKIDVLSDSDAFIRGSKTFDLYKSNCMRFADDLAKLRGTTKFQICSVTSDEVNNFLERLRQLRRPETVHQYASALNKLEKMCCQHFGDVSWRIDDFARPRRVRDDITVQRGAAYTPEEADKLIRELRNLNPPAGDALEFIRATGCRAESVFGTLRNKGKQVYRDFTKTVTTDRIDLDTRTVTLLEKGGKVRKVEYDSQYQKFMEKLVKRNLKGNIFIGLNQKVIYNQIKAITNKNGFPGRGLHGMRKTFAIQRYNEYFQKIEELCQSGYSETLFKEFPTTNQKARHLSANPSKKSIDILARLRLSKDLGHNRLEVTYRYVPKK